MQNEIVLNAVQGPFQLEPSLLSEESGSASIRNKKFSDETIVFHKTVLQVPTEAVPGCVHLSCCTLRSRKSRRKVKSAISQGF